MNIFYGKNYINQYVIYNHYLLDKAYLWNNRKVNDGDRAVEAIKGIIGKRLAYRRAIA